MDAIFGAGGGIAEAGAYEIADGGPIGPRGPGGDAPGVTVLGVALGLGASHAGVAFGPEALRRASLVQRLQQGGYDVADCGDLHVLPFAPNSSAFAPGIREAAGLRSWIWALSGQAYELAASGSIPVVLGGEHSLSIGTINGVGRYWAQRGRPSFVIWIDAFADIDTPLTSSSGSLAEMAAAVVLGGCDPMMVGAPPLGLPADRFAALGLQWASQAERAALAQRCVTVLPLGGTAAARTTAALERLLARIAACDGVIHLSIDVSVVRAASAGGRSAARRQGDRLLALAERIGRSGRVAAADLVQLNPVLDDDPAEAGRAVELLCAALGPAAAQPRAQRFCTNTVPAE